MKRVFALVLILLGMVLMNSPPVMDQQLATVDDVMISADLYDIPMMIMADAINPGVNTCYGGLVLQTYETSWSATISYDNTLEYIQWDNQIALQNARDKLDNSTGQSIATLNDRKFANENMEGLFRLSVGNQNATWRIQETYI